MSRASRHESYLAQVVGLIEDATYVVAAQKEGKAAGAGTTELTRRIRAPHSGSHSRSRSHSLSQTSPPRGVCVSALTRCGPIKGRRDLLNLYTHALFRAARPTRAQPPALPATRGPGKVRQSDSMSRAKQRPTRRACPFSPSKSSAAATAPRLPPPPRLFTSSVSVKRKRFDAVQGQQWRDLCSLVVEAGDATGVNEEHPVASVEDVGVLRDDLVHEVV